MPLLAKEVIHAARDAHPGFSRSAAPDAVVLRALARYQQELLGRIAAIKQDAVHVEVDVALPLADFDAGAHIAQGDDPPVPVEYITVHGAVAHPSAPDHSRTPIRLVPYVQRTERFSTLAAYLRGERLFLLGTADDWKGVDRITVDLFPVGPNSIDFHTGALMLPGRAQATCVAAMALFMAGRVPEAPAQTLAAMAAAAEELYLDQVTDRRRAKVIVPQGAW